MSILGKLKELGIEPLSTVIIGRCEGTEWQPMILKDISLTKWAAFQIYGPDGEDWSVEMIAPLEGNEDRIGTEDTDCIVNLIDCDFIREV
jgi:hypothetical protein